MKKKRRWKQIFPLSSFHFPLFLLPLHPLRGPDGGIGRRAGLKHQWGNPCRFDPGSGYYKYHNVLVSKKDKVL